MHQDALVPFQDDGGQQERGGSFVVVPGGQQMPERLIIGTQEAFERNYAFPYEKKQIGSETIYVCNKGSAWARAEEVLVR